jgi:hypothetical protein
MERLAESLFSSLSCASLEAGGLQKRFTRSSPQTRPCYGLFLVRFSWGVRLEREKSASDSMMAKLCSDAFTGNRK